ncbi:MAG: hypothetical protein EKK33_06075 [Bradyrhizobiaceae bacterium]|nr:MAG: hypothetical protein EKK33_06075 [Bradyrhizobiaceae bacterium]
MANSPTLIAAVVEATGEPKPAVEVALRRLRTAELIPVGGRGPYSAKMDYVSAMRMLLAVCASIKLERDANVLAVKRFEPLTGGLDNNETLVTEGYDPASIKLPIDHLDHEHALGDAVITLLRAGAAGELYTYQETGPGRAVFKAKGYLRLSFYQPIPFARIEHVVGHVRKVWRYGFLGGASLDGYISVMRERHLGGRLQMSEIDGRAVEIIGEAVAD